MANTWLYRENVIFQMVGGNSYKPTCFQQHLSRITLQRQNYFMSSISGDVHTHTMSLTRRRLNCGCNISARCYSVNKSSLETLARMTAGSRPDVRCETWSRRLYTSHHCCASQSLSALVILCHRAASGQSSRQISTNTEFFLRNIKVFMCREQHPCYKSTPHWNKTARVPPMSSLPMTRCHLFSASVEYGRSTCVLINSYHHFISILLY